MKNLIFLTFLIIFSGCRNYQKQEKQIVQNISEKFIKNVDASEFKKLIDSDKGVILDVRTPEEISEGFINMAHTINIYDEDFEERINLLPKEKTIYVYCKAGGRSAKAGEILQKYGFNKVYNLNNGIMEWQEKGFPVVKSQNDTIR